MKIILDQNEVFRWSELYLRANPLGGTDEWKKDLCNIFATCLHAMAVYWLEIDNKDDPSVKGYDLATLSDRVIGLLVVDEEKEINGEDIYPDDEEPKDYEEEYRELVEDILVSLLIFTKHVELRLSTSGRSMINSNIGLSVDEHNAIIEITPKGEPPCLN